MNAINLLPWAFRRKLLIRTRVAQWSVATLLGCGLVAGAAWFQHARLTKRESALARLQARSESLAQLQTETAQFRDRVTSSRKVQSILSHVENQELPLRAIGLAGHVVSTLEGRLEVQGMALSRSVVSIPIPDKPKEFENQDVVSLVLNGRAADNLAIADMVLKLRETGVFETVALRAAAARPTAPIAGQAVLPSFQVECVCKTRSL
ncbi:MAG: hypothetical protein IT428_20105 [Planctomycetaceae bacterium]|nr:hypothetical protein [Planctomycetaceae bacterium]